MRPFILAMVVVVLGGCAARPATQRSYACGDARVEVVGRTLYVGEDLIALQYRDRAGAHYARSHGDGVLDYVIPSNPRLDATVWNRESSGGASVDQVCTAHGGYVDVTSRWLAGQSLDEIATELDLGGERAARRRLINALQWMRQHVPDGRLVPASLALPKDSGAGKVCQAGKDCQARER
jgi:hypothetical protein